MKTMSYIKTGEVKSKSRNVNYFRELSTSSMLYGVGREIYRRYDTECWMLVSFGLLGWTVWNRLGM